MGWSSLRWACATVAPWCLATGLLVSFTASAGIDSSTGYLVSTLSRDPVAAPEDLIPAARSRLEWPVRSANALSAGVLQPVRLYTGEPDPEPLDRGEGPRSDMKAGVGAFPQVDRSRKGDPTVALRPSLSRLKPLVNRPDLDPIALSDPHDTPATIFLPSEGDVPGPDSVASFEPMPSLDSTLTQAANAGPSPEAVASDGTSTPSRGIARTTTSSSPTVPRAIALSSTTPAPADAIPVEIAAAPVSAGGLAAMKGKGGFTPVPKDSRPDYASLIDPDRISKEQRCLAEAVYFEARSEPEEGQAAVAQVVLNRVKSGLYPGSVCGVVYQNRHRHLACQFTFACEGKALRITEPDAWQTAVRIAREVTEGKTYLSEVGSSTHYHADYVRPYWAKRLKRMDVIGRHVFYKLRPGQT
jgi:hypothetical protein